MTESREKIIASAIELFVEKGKYGVRMEEIGARAGVNKAMVYYYFSTKENIYREVVFKIIENTFNQITEKITGIIASPLSYAEKVREVIRAHFTVFSNSANHPEILLGALANNPEHIRNAVADMFKKAHIPDGNAIENLLIDGINAGVFRNVDPKQTVISILGMNLIFFIRKSIGQTMLNCHVDDESEFFEVRLDSVIDLFLNGIIANPSKEAN